MGFGTTGAARRLPVRLVLLALILTLVFSNAFPVIVTAAAFAKRNSDLPCVVCPSSYLDLQLVEANGATVRLSSLPEQWRAFPSERVFEVGLRYGAYPGLEWADPIPDWQSFVTLVLDAINPESLPLRLTLRIDDVKHDNRYVDRFNYSFILPAGTRHREYIPLFKLREAPEDRDMDLARIRRIVLFGSADTHGRWFYLRSIRLQVAP